MSRFYPSFQYLFKVPKLNYFVSRISCKVIVSEETLSYFSRVDEHTYKCNICLVRIKSRRGLNHLKTHYRDKHSNDPRII